MKHVIRQALHYLVLTAITVGAAGVMWWVSSKNTGVSLITDSDIAKPPAPAAVRAPVAVANLRPKMCELTIRYTGKIRPWESFALGFEIGGRVQALGENKSGQPLDDGDRVRAGQVLARLDDRIYRARRAEAVAQLEQADSDMKRAKQLYERGEQFLTEAEYQEALTTFALRQAQLEVTTKELEDAVLVSPVDGAISRRMVEAGESVAANTMVFDVVQNDQLLLVVDVPESRIRELQLRQRAVARARAEGGPAEDRVFRARVFLEGRDAFGDRWPPIDAEVYRIAQVADERTGLFEVEVRIPNESRLLRPGMVAAAEIVTDRILAYEAPETAVVFRGEEAYVFAVETEPADMQVMFWDVGDTRVARARRIDLERWIDQGDRIIVPAASLRMGPIITRGQRRLADGQPLRIVNEEAIGGGAIAETRSDAATASKNEKPTSDKR